MVPEAVLPPRYRLWPDPERALLGKGGASEVWRVQDEAVGILVALKVLRTEGARFQARLEREAVLAARVMHPNVVALHDVGRTPEDRPYLAFALASDGSMLDIAPSPPPWPELMDLTIQCLQALAALHARGILHLDVKLSNLLLHRTLNRRVLWLADLGVARAQYGDEDEDPAIIGTVSYMSPERLTGKHHLWQPSSDLFAVGAVLYRLLTGKLPFPARDPSAALTERYRPPTALSPRNGYAVPKGLDEVVLPMLEPDPRHRFDLAGDVIRGLMALPLTETEESSEPEDPAGPSEITGVARLRPYRLRVSAAETTASAPRRSSPHVPPWHRPPAWDVGAELPRIRHRRRVPQALQLLVHREIEMVGRKDEFEVLWRAGRSAMRSRKPLMVELTGEWGVGRTRLVEEFTRSIEEASLGEGVRLDYGVRMGPQLGLRGAWRRIAPPGSPRDAYAREVAALLARDRGVPLARCAEDGKSLSEWIAPTQGDDDGNRSLARALLVEHLERRAWRGLSWLWLEDAHLADENDDCWAVVDLLLSRAAPVLILVTTRAESSTPSLVELRARHHRSVRTIELSPLESGENLANAHVPLESGLGRRLADYARGNPRAMREILAHWVRLDVLTETSAASEEGRIWTLREGAPPLPADRAAFARERLAAIGRDSGKRAALLALALGGNGIPDRVLARVAGESLDRLVIEGLVDMEQGGVFPVPPELSEVVLEEAHPEHLPALHLALAEAWSAEGDDPAVLARVGQHRWEGGQRQEALAPLDCALRELGRIRPVPEVEELARRTRAAALEADKAGGPAWVHATMTLASVLWRGGHHQEARLADDELERQELIPRDFVRVTTGRIRRTAPDEPVADSRRMVALEEMWPRMPAPVRAEILVARALRRALRLDHQGALDDIYEALASRPEAEAECRAHLLRARLLAVSDPMVAWHEALRTVEVARDHGLLRFEVLAWGLVGENMAVLGRGDDAVERIRAGVARLEAHGDRRAAAEARVHLGAVLRTAGRADEALVVWRDAIDKPLPAYGTVVLCARDLLAVQAALQRDASTIRALRGPGPRMPASITAWEMLLPLSDLLSGRRATVDPRLIARAPALGLEGLFLSGALQSEMLRRGFGPASQALGTAVDLASRALGVDPRAAGPLVASFEQVGG